MKHILLAVALAFCAVITFPAKADAFVWGNVYGDFTVQKGLKGNPLEEVANENLVLGAEGGIVTSGVNAYAFAEHNAHLESTFVKGTIHVDVYKDVSIYSQLSNFNDKAFSEGRALVGVGYTGLANDQGGLTPFVGWNLADNTFEDDNFAMFGWTANYKITKALSINNWHESEVNKGITANGAVGLSYETNWLVKDSYIGVQYRYMFNAAGVDGFGDAVMFRIGTHL